MKVLCPACERLVELAHFHVDGEALVVTCEKCGEKTRVEQHQAAGPQQDSPSPPPARGPKPAATEAKPGLSLASTPGASNVVRLRTNTIAAVEAALEAADNEPFAVPAGLCPKCVAKRGDAAVCAQCGLDFGLVDAGGLAPAPWLQAAWVELLREWGDEKKHDALCSQALERNALVEVGRLYRLRLAHQPDDPMAERGRGEVLRLATLNVGLPGKSEEVTRQLKQVKLIGAIILLVLSLSVGMLLVRALMRAP